MVQTAQGIARRVYPPGSDGDVIRVVTLFLFALGIFCAWYFGARNAALLADIVGTSRSLGTKTMTQIGWNGSYLVIDGQTFPVEDSRDVRRLELSVDTAHRLIATANRGSIVLGIEHGALTLPGDPEAKPAFHAERGDRITITRTQGRLSWPDWFETNWMTGNSPRWKRFVTYRLHWQKPSGASFELFWRFEQWYYPMDGWTTANMMGASFCGLVGARIASGKT